jgi:hypothetical protein
MPVHGQPLPSCVLVDNSNAEINASRSAYIRVFVMNKLLQDRCSKHCPCIYRQNAPFFLSGRQHSFQVVNTDDIAAWRVHTCISTCLQSKQELVLRYLCPLLKRSLTNVSKNCEPWIKDTVATLFEA